MIRLLPWKEKAHPNYSDILATTKNNLRWYQELAPDERAWANLYIHDVFEQMVEEQAA